MKYERPLKRNTGPDPFSIGTHSATIEKVIRKKSKNDNNMFMLTLEGKAKEAGVFFLTFGNNYTQENMSYLLASIEDNGTDIPEIAFGYNADTLNFLIGKDVFIKVEMKPTITTFLTLQEFEENGDEFDEQEPFSDEW